MFSRLLSVLFGAIIIFAFFLSWIKVDTPLGNKQISGFSIFRGVSKVESKVEKVKDAGGKLKEKLHLKKKDEIPEIKMPSKIYALLFFPLVGVIAIVFSGFLRVPLLTLLASAGSVGYFAYQYFGSPSGGGKLQEWFINRTSIEIGLILTLVSLLMIILTAFGQLLSGGKKKAAE